MSIRKMMLASIIFFITLVVIMASFSDVYIAFGEVASTSLEKTSSYTIIKVLNASGSRAYYDVNNITSASDASIRQTYRANIKLEIYDENLSKDMFLLPSDIVETPTSNNTIVLGSFLYDTKSSVEDIQSYDGYLQFTLNNVKYSGNGKKLEMRIAKWSYSFELSLEVAECIPRSATVNNDNNTDNRPVLEAETPYVIVSQYSYGGDVSAGDTFILGLTLRNTSDSIDISNMTLTLGMPEDLMLTSSSNTFYIENLAMQETVTKAAKVTAKPSAKPQSHNITASLKYQYVDEEQNTRKTVTTEETIAIPVTQIDRFEITSVDLPAEVMVGEEVYVTVNFVNKGRSEVYNLSAEIIGNIQNPGQKQNLGNLTSGATGSADFYIIAAEPGLVSGEIIISYEDTNNQLKESSIQYSCESASITVPDGSDSMGDIDGSGNDIPPLPEKKTSYSWIIFIVLITGGVAAFFIRKKLLQKRGDSDENNL